MTKKNNLLIYIYTYATYLIMFCTPIEPLLKGLYKPLKYLYIAFFLVIFISKKYKKESLNFYYLLMIIFLAISGFSIVISNHKQSSISMFIELATNLFLAIGASYCLKIKGSNMKENNLSKIIYSFIYGNLIMTLYLIIFELPSMGKWGRLGYDLYENYGSFMVYSYCEIISICYLLWDIFINYPKNDKNVSKSKIKKIIMLLILIIGALVSGTRKAILCPIIFMACALLIQYKDKLGKMTLYFVIMLVALIIGYKIMMTNEIFYNRIGSRIESMIESVKSQNIVDGSINERATLKKLSIKCFLDNPILGYGLHAFRYYSYNNGGPYLYSHCNFTEILADLGIIGFVPYYLAYLYIIIKSKKLVDLDKVAVFIVSFMIMCTIADYSTVSYYRQHFLIIYFLLASYLQLVYQIKKTLKK